MGKGWGHKITVVFVVMRSLVVIVNRLFGFLMFIDVNRIVR